METLRQSFKKAENPCEASGCQSLCCQSPHIVMDEYTRKSKFPNAIEVPEGTNFKDNTLPRGEYYKDLGIRSDSGWAKLVEYKAQDMRCPNLKEDGRCRIYKSRPDGCKNLKFGGRECDEFRNDGGLPTINQLIQIENIK